MLNLKRWGSEDQDASPFSYRLLLHYSWKECCESWVSGRWVVFSRSYEAIANRKKNGIPDFKIHHNSVLQNITIQVWLSPCFWQWPFSVSFCDWQHIRNSYNLSLPTTPDTLMSTFLQIVPPLYFYIFPHCGLVVNLYFTTVIQKKAEKSIKQVGWSHVVPHIVRDNVCIGGSGCSMGLPMFLH